MFVDEKMKNEIIKNINLVTSLLKYSPLFKELYNNRNKNDYKIIDKFNNFTNIINNIDQEKILNMLYRGRTFKGKIFKEILEDIVQDIIIDEKYDKIHFILESNKFVNDYVCVEIYCDTTCSDEIGKHLFISIQHNQKRVILTIDEKCIKVEFAIYTPYYKNNNVVYNDDFTLSIDMVYFYDNVKKMYIRPKIVRVFNEDEICIRDFNILEDLIFDLQVHDDEFSDTIYKYCIAEACKAVKRIFKNRNNLLINNFSKISPIFNNNEFNEFLIRNLHSYKYEEDISWEIALMEDNDNIYCMNVINDDYEWGIYTGTILKVSKKDNFMDEFVNYVHDLLNTYKTRTTYYNVLQAFKEFLSLKNIDDIKEYSSRIFYEDYNMEIKEWSEKVYELDNENLFWVDDFSKDENVINEEELIEILKNNKEEKTEE